MNVAIIGAGPAGLLAAWGAATSGAEVRIFDPNPAPLPDRILGLQYLHELCGLPVEEVRKLELWYQIIPNNPEGGAFIRPQLRRAYNFKLGRPLEEVNSTSHITAGPGHVYSLKDAYTFLHHQFRYDILTRAVTWDEINGELSKDFDIVINTAPLDKLLPQLVWPTRDAWIQFSLPDDVEVLENTCVYNLDVQVPWYRATNLDGSVSTEMLYPEGQLDVPGRLLRKVVKPDHIIGPFRPNVYLAGRWGSWNPHALTSDAYRVARGACK